MIVTYMAPAVAVAAGVVFLSEPLTSTILIAFALILSGSVLATGKGARKPDDTAPPHAEQSIPAE